MQVPIPYYTCTVPQFKSLEVNDLENQAQEYSSENQD